MKQETTNDAAREQNTKRSLLHPVIFPKVSISPLPPPHDNQVDKREGTKHSVKRKVKEEGSET